MHVLPVWSERRALSRQDQSTVVPTWGQHASVIREHSVCTGRFLQVRLMHCHVAQVWDAAGGLRPQAQRADLN